MTNMDTDYPHNFQAGFRKICFQSSINVQHSQISLDFYDFDLAPLKIIGNIMLEDSAEHI